VVRHSLGVLSLSLFLGAVTSLIPCTASGGGGLPAAFSRNYSRAVVRVVSYDWRGVLLREGRGVVISPGGDLVTTIPIMDGAYFSEAVFPNGGIRVIEQIRRVNEASGLLIASLEEPDEELPCLKANASFPETGNRVWVFSGNGSDRLNMTETTVEEVREIPGLTAFRYLRSSGTPGDPGSPVFNQRGQITGIVVLTLPEPEAGYVIASSSILSGYHGRDTTPVLLEVWVEERAERWEETRRGAYLEGIAHLWSGNHKKARSRLVHAVLGNDRISGYATLALGECFLANEQPDRAVEAFLAALEKRHNSIEAKLGLSRAYLAQRKIAEARHIYEQIAISWPEDSRTYVVMAEILNITGSPTAAINVARLAVKLNPACAETSATLGKLLMIQGRFEEAVGLLESLPASFHAERRSVKDLCYANLRSGRLPRAVEVCSSAAEKRVPGAFMYLGEAYAIMGSGEQARRCLTQSLEEATDNVTVICRLGDLLFEMGQEAESVQLYEKAIARRPNSDWLRFKLGKTLCLLGERGLAVKQLDTLKELNPMLAGQLALHLPAP
jgi:tetratricopeptide (TPR) repeat protein